MDMQYSLASFKSFYYFSPIVSLHPYLFIKIKIMKIPFVILFDYNNHILLKINSYN